MQPMSYILIQTIMTHTLRIRAAQTKQVAYGICPYATGEAICLRHLGQVHHLHGDHHEALSALDRSLTLCLRRDDAKGQALCHEHIAVSLVGVGL